MPLFVPPHTVHSNYKKPSDQLVENDEEGLARNPACCFIEKERYKVIGKLLETWNFCGWKWLQCILCAMLSVLQTQKGA